MLDEIVRYAWEKGATDIHIGVDRPIYYRKSGDILPYPSDMRCSLEDINALLKISEGSHQEAVDFSTRIAGVRVRVHLYQVGGVWAASLRLLHPVVGKLEEDRDAEMLQSLCYEKEGLILVTGPTGSGKSYLLHRMLDFINRKRAVHMITLEDPIEVLMDEKRALIHQRELPRDVQSMARGIREAMREDPDVIMIGEMRDADTVLAALYAAETGHLVFSTMHTGSSLQAVSRIVSFFEESQQIEVRFLLAQVLKGVVCQRLSYVAQRIYPLRDILYVTKAVRNMIRQKKEYQMTSLQDMHPWMRTWRTSVTEAIQKWEHASYFESFLEEHE